MPYPILWLLIAPVIQSLVAKLIAGGRVLWVTLMTIFLALLDITFKDKVAWSRSAPCVTGSPLGLISGSLHFSSIVRTV